MEVQNTANGNSLTNNFLKVIASFLSHNANVLKPNVDNAHNTFYRICPGIAWGQFAVQPMHPNLAQ
jgi:hypothetical protein